MKQGQAFFLGFLSGAGVLLAAVIVMMPRMMITTHESRYEDVDQTVEALKAAIHKEGWRSPGVRNISATITGEGVAFAPAIRIVELCKADYAARVLLTNPEVSTLMPCAWGVYRDKDGKVRIAGMNMGLMGRVFGGNIARVMSDKVAVEEARMLEAVVK